MIEQVAALIAARQLLSTGVQSVLPLLKDTTLPLADRWDAYKELVENDILVNNEIYGDGMIDILGPNMTLYDDFSIDRHQTETFVDMYDRIMEADGEWEESLVKARETNLTAWQEAVLASGYSSFTYDW